MEVSTAGKEGQSAAEVAKALESVKRWLQGLVLVMAFFLYVWMADLRVKTVQITNLKADVKAMKQELARQREGGESSSGKQHQGR